MTQDPPKFAIGQNVTFRDKTTRSVIPWTVIDILVPTLGISEPVYFLANGPSRVRLAESLLSDAGKEEYGSQTV